MRITERCVETARALMPEDWEGRRCLHFSFLYRGKKLLVVGQNDIKTHARNRYNKKWENAGTCSELNCFIRAKNTISDLNWEKLMMVNVRLGRKGELMNSSPCKSCHNLYNYLNIKELWFSTENGFKKY